MSAAPTSVSIETTGTRSYTALTQDTDFELWPYNALLEGQPYTELHIISGLSSYTWAAWQKGVQVVAKFGYPSIPGDIKEAALMMAQSMNASRSGQPNPGKITVTAAGVVIRPEEIPTYAQRVISHYRGHV